MANRQLGTALVFAALVGAALTCAGCPSDPSSDSPEDAGLDAQRAPATNVGAPCDPLAAAGPTQAVYNNQALECDSRICLKPLDNTGVADTRAFCSSPCTTDNDCGGVLRDSNDPNDRRCASGFACATIFVAGPLCCKKLCLCKDFLAGPPSTPAGCEIEAGQPSICM